MSASSRLGAIALVLGAVAMAGCAASSDGDDGTSTGASAQTAATREGYVYFHGMSHLGFSHDALRAGLGAQSLLAPSMSDAQIQSGPSSAVVDFVSAKSDALVAGYSLGRIPVLRMMSTNAHGMTRVVMIDPTYDSAASLGGSGISGGIAKEWLDGDPERTLMLVYGDVTKSLGGEKSYVRELAHHERATLCYVRGDHERFRQSDMVAALVAKDCDDLTTRLAAP